MKSAEIVQEVLDDVYETSRPAKESVDAEVVRILGKVGDGEINGDNAFGQVEFYLYYCYGGDKEYATEAAGALLDAFRIPHLDSVKNLVVADAETVAAHQAIRKTPDRFISATDLP